MTTRFKLFVLVAFFASAASLHAQSKSMCKTFFDSTAKLHTRVECAEALFSDPKFHFTFSGLPPGNGFALGGMFEDEVDNISSSGKLSSKQAKLSIVGSTCQGEHGINKEACNAKGGGAGLMYGFFDGMKLEPTAQVSTVRRSSARSIPSQMKHRLSKQRNPIKLVRQSAKRERIPDVLELVEIQLLLSKLGVRERTLVLLEAGTGLRVSELLALRWRDVDFDNLELSVTRSIWHQVVGDCKTEASAKPVPLDSYMADDLLRWRRQSAYPLIDDYVFASETMRGKQPYWPDNLMKRHIRPVAKAIGIHKRIGWHTFRHTFGTLLKANGEDVKTVQELLRHANSRITLEVYTQATTSNKRAAQSKVLRMMVPNLGETKDEKHPQKAG